MKAIRRIAFFIILPIITHITLLDGMGNSRTPYSHPADLEPQDPRTNDFSRATLQGRSLFLYHVNEILDGRNTSDTGARQITVYERDKRGAFVTDEDGKKKKKYEKPKVLTLLDYFTIEGLGDDEIVQLVEKSLGVSLFEKEGMDYINLLFNLANGWEDGKTDEDYKDKHQPGLYRLLRRNPPSLIKNFKFKVPTDVINFLRKTTQKDYQYRQSFCSFAKLMLGLHEILSDERFASIDDDFEHFLGELAELCSLTEIPGKNGNKISSGNINKILVDGSTLSIPFSIEHRRKGFYQLVIKGLSKAEVDKNSLYNDPLGMRFTVRNKTDAVFLLEFIFINIFNRNIHDFEQKGFFEMVDGLPHTNESTLDIDTLYYNLDPAFLEALEKKLHTKRTAKNSPKWKDVKMEGTKRMGEKEIGYELETQVVLTDNVNEVGLASHDIYDGWKLIQVVERIDGYVTENFILRVLEMLTNDRYGTLFAPEVKKIVSSMRTNKYNIKAAKKELEGKKFFKDAIHSALFDFILSVYTVYKSRLVTLIDDHKFTRYKTLERFEVLNEAGLLPKNVLGARDIDGVIIGRIPDGELAVENIS